MGKNKLIFGISGSGKTEFAINFGKKILKENKNNDRVTLVDLDLNNYLSLSSIKENLNKCSFNILGKDEKKNSTELILINDKIYSKFLDKDIKIVDTCYGEDGIEVINSLSKVIDKNDTEVFLLINPFREETCTKSKIVNYIQYFNVKSNFKIDYIVGNPNLKDSTTYEEILYGDNLIKNICDEVGIIYQYILINKKLELNNFNSKSHNVFLIERNFIDF